MKVVILPSAIADLVAGHEFYEKQEPGIGGYFLKSLYADIDSLAIHAGIHRQVFGSQRHLSKKFPFAIYYTLADETVYVKAILDCRRDPSRHSQRLRSPAP